MPEPHEMLARLWIWICRARKQSDTYYGETKEFAVQASDIWEAGHIALNHMGSRPTEFEGFQLAEVVRNQQLVNGSAVH